MKKLLPGSVSLLSKAKSSLALRAILVGLGLAVLAIVGGSARAVPLPTTPQLDASVPSAASCASQPVDFGASIDASPASVSLAPAPLPVSPLPPPASASSTRATPDDPVRLNEATFEDLRRLPGVGPKRAEAILQLRTKLVHFKQIEDLMKVKGIGRATLKKLRPLVKL